ncbi:MAG: MarR family transcriptional regulator, partial [Candidatus Omnitrophota bacterium]
VRRHHCFAYKDKVTLSQMFILEYLQEHSPSRMTELANFMKVSAAASTGMVQRLVLLGYIQREYNQKDRRVVMIRISAKGSEFLKKMNQQRFHMISSVFGKLTEKDRQEYLRIITQVRDILEKEDN